MKNQVIVSGCITACFVGVYLLLRNLPDTQCDILHYEITRETANGVEMCADGPSGFIDLDRIRFPGMLQLHSPGNLNTGEPYQGRISILGPTDESLLPHEIAITHAAKIHMIVIHENLGEYHHLHPQPLQGTGDWVFEFTPETSGVYNIYAECVPLRTQNQLIVKDSLLVEDNKTLSHPASEQIQSPESFRINWDFKNETLGAESQVNFTIALASKDDAPIILERFMDAYSHVVAFRDGSIGYAHIHPTSTDLPNDSRHPEFSFTFFTGKAGQYRLWAQFQVNGKSVFMPYDIEVI